MASPQSQQPATVSDFLRVINILVLIGIGYILWDYAPLVPRIAILMDDIHVIRSHSEDFVALKKSAAAIEESLANLQKKFNFFKREAERQGVTWPEDP